MFGFFCSGDANCPLNVVSYHDLAVLTHAFYLNGKMHVGKMITGKEANHQNVKQRNPWVFQDKVPNFSLQFHPHTNTRTLPTACTRSSDVRFSRICLLKE